MTDYNVLIDNLIIAATHYALNTSNQIKGDKLIAESNRLIAAIKDLQDQAAVSDINKIVQNLVEMRSILNGKRIEELEKELAFYRLQEPVVISWTPVFAGDIPDNVMVLVKTDRPIFHYMGIPYFSYVCRHRGGKFYMMNTNANCICECTISPRVEEVKGVTHYAIIDKVAK